MGAILGDRGGEGPPLTATEREVLWILGKMAALAAMARAATRQHERAAALEQRIDLAREVHEGVVQRLFGVSLALSGDQPFDEETRRRCAEEVQAALGDLRAAMQRPLGRSAAATKTTLAEEVARLATSTPTSGSSSTASRIEAPEALEPLAQSVLAEAIRNAHKHANATRVGVRTETADGTFVLEVTNDGVTPDGAGRPGWGLRLAGFEALQAGGLLEFGAREQDRWQVRLVVPSRTHERRPAKPPTAEHAKLRVLIVDDHDVVHWGFRLMLGNQPWVERCLSARTGRRGLRARDPLQARCRARRPLHRRGVRSRDLPAVARALAGNERAADQRRRADLAGRGEGGRAPPASSPRTGAPPTSPARCGWWGWG